MSDTISGGAHVQRGLVLMEQGRFSDAANFFRQALAQNPRDAFALNRLAICQLQLPAEQGQALDTIHRALECEPNEPLNHAVKAYVLGARNRSREALDAARLAVTLDPDSVFALNAQAYAHCLLEQWADAERVARRALSLDADNSIAANHLAHALRLQNKMAENAGQIAGMLARDPEDAATHCNAGWAALQRGERRVAEQHFFEALRLDPEMEPARAGLLNAFRSRSPLYRAYLAYCFKMSRMGKNARWGVILGLYFGVKFARVFLKGPAGIAIGLLYLVFVLWVWVAKGVGNFILLFDRFARHALRRNEKIEAFFVGGSICLGIALLLASFAIANSAPFFLAVGIGCSAVPFSMTFTNPSRVGSIIFGFAGGAALLGGIAGAISALYPNVLSENTAMVFWGGGILVAMLTTWLGNISALRH